MLEEFEGYRRSVGAEIRRFLHDREIHLRHVNQWAPDFLSRLARFSDQGKMVRGCMAYAAYHLFRDDDPTALARAAAAIEIIHSSLLIHDDIMDRDLYRRGGRSIYSQYEELAGGRGAREASHIGQSMGICGGDIGYFLAFELLSTIENPGIGEALMGRWAQELVAVGLAQMDDIALAVDLGDALPENIINLYRYKTARYTFSLPMVTGALIAGQSGALIESLEKLGEVLGIIFQIKDDELGVYGKTSRTGKPVGNDIQEGKKTLFVYYLRELMEGRGERPVSPEDIEVLEGAFSGRDLTAGDMDDLRRIASENGVAGRINDHVQDLARQAEVLIDRLAPRMGAAADGARALFRRMLDFNLRRTR
jgi:geranylgeranyl diphosphate synthase type I